jgi:hypothetical protein
MGFFGITPFSKESIDNYAGVLVPLSQERQDTIVANNDANRQSAEGSQPSVSHSERESSSETGLDGSDLEDRRLNKSTSSCSSHTLEGLRAEVTAEADARGENSSYNCEFLRPGGLLQRSSALQPREIQVLICQ